MCGIFGAVISSKSGLSDAQVSGLLKSLFLESESRGKEASGLAICSPTNIQVLREPCAASELIKSKKYIEYVNDALILRRENPNITLSFLGHARLVTNGLQGIDQNNQPVVKGSVVCVHNGIIVNESKLWSEHTELVREAQVDTEVVAALVDSYLNSSPKEYVQAISDCFSKIYGEASIAFAFKDHEAVHVATNTGSVYFIAVEGLAFFCSEQAITERVLNKLKKLGVLVSSNIQQVKANEYLLLHHNPTFIKLQDIGQGKILNDSSTISSNFSHSEPSVERSITTSFDTTYKRWKNLRRCTKCVLPETMPFIKFDGDGVCSFCNNYNQIKLKGEEPLLRILDKYRSKDGSADCLVGFSGGRDSSYGLHLLKTKYGMNPIAYTYDWGMVTDLARRNQARLCGKLGIEHIWVSADIKAKRNNVRQNVTAWLKRPELGMVPLFMAGDKQFMWHANRLMKETGLRLMVYSTNHLERTDFKTGFCGVPPNNDGVQLNKLKILSTIKFLSYYLKNYAVNPAYINGSLGDTFTAFLSYYFVKQDFLYLFDYIHWDELEINAALTKNYEWEFATDTNTSWRIGDGTAPFYNYIYQTIAGFSEYETFRSNQIREGVIDRASAIELITTENLPRFDSIKDYCITAGLDFDTVMRGIARIPKLY